MKKKVRQILSLVFVAGLLISVIGVPVNDHYCSDSLIATTLGLPIDDPCGDMPMEGNCCDDETTLFSITDYFSITSLNLVNSITPAVLVCNYTACTKLIPQPVEFLVVADHDPPPIESRIFVEIQSFLL